MGSLTKGGLLDPVPYSCLPDDYDFRIFSVVHGRRLYLVAAEGNAWNHVVPRSAS